MATSASQVAVRRQVRRASDAPGEAFAEEMAPLVEGLPPHEGYWSTLPSLAWNLMTAILLLSIPILVLAALALSNTNSILAKEDKILSAIAELKADFDACCQALKDLLADVSSTLATILANTQTIIDLIEAIDLTPIETTLATIMANTQTLLTNTQTLLTNVAAVLANTVEILADLAALQTSIDDCCAALQAAVAEILTDLATILSQLTTLLGLSNQILSVVQDLELAQCVPLWAASQILDPGCYYFATDIDCNATNPDACFLVNNDVSIDGRGRTLTVLDNGTTAFLIPFVWDVRLRNMKITTPTKTSNIQSKAVYAFATDHVVLEDVHISNFFRPIQAEYVTALRLEGLTVVDADQPDLVDGYTTRSVSLLATSGVFVDQCLFERTNVRGGDAHSLSYGFTAVAADGLSSDGLFIRNSVFSDSMISIVTSSEFDPVTNVIIEDNAFDVSDPLFPHQFIGIGGCPLGSRCAPSSSLIVRGNSMSNRDAAPTFDGIWMERADAALIERNAIVSNSNGSAPDYASLFAAPVHICWGQSAVWADGQSGYCRGVVVRDNSIVGGPYNTTSGAAYQRQASWGILLEAGAYQVLVERNSLYGFAGGMGAGTNAFNASYPAQTPAAVYVGAGTVGCHVKENSISEFGDAVAPQTVGGAGVWVAGGGFFSSLLSSSASPVYFDPALTTRVEANSAAYGTGVGFKDQGSNTRLWHNEAHTNLGGDYSVPSTTVLQCFGCLQRAGWNLHDCNAPSGNWTC